MGRPKKSQQQENQRILEHVREYKASGSQEAFGEIMDALEPFFQHLSCRKFFYVPGHDSGDLYQEALMALQNKAIPDYVESKGPFLAFAKLCVRRHIITVLKSSNNNRHKMLNNSLSIDATVSDDDDDGPLTVGHFISNDEESIFAGVSRREMTNRLKRMLVDRLTSLEKQVLALYLRNMSYMDIVKEMNRYRRGENRVNAKVVDNALCRIKKKALELREERLGEGEDLLGD